MQNFTVDPRDGFFGSGACSTCCCAEVAARPGEVNKWGISYAPWVIPIGGKGLTQNTTIQIEDKTPSTTPAGDAPPTAPFHGADVTFNTLFSLDLTTIVTDPEAAPLSFALLPMYGPASGIATISVAGQLEYTPLTGFVGYDRLFYSVSDGVNKPVIGEIVFAVSAALPTPPLPTPTDQMATPKVSIPKAGVVVNNRWHEVTFPVKIGPTAQIGDVFRITVRQQALDCDCQEYWHVSCYDVIIGKC